MIKRTFNPGFRIGLHQKDLNLALAGARALGVALPQTAGAAQLMQACAANGMQDLDHSALVRALELMANHEVGRRPKIAAMSPDPKTDPREFLRALYDAAVARALPAQNTARFLPAAAEGPHAGARRRQGRRRDGRGGRCAVADRRAAVRPGGHALRPRAAGLQGEARPHRGGRSRAPGARCGRASARRSASSS